MQNFALIDTETNWANQVMSIGTVIADPMHFEPLEMHYHILPLECEIGGMYYDTLFLDTPVPPVLCAREEAIRELKAIFHRQKVGGLFAYNASFDRNHLPELRGYPWFDIMRLAAYRQYNPKIPLDSDFCSTGRLKRGYGVEAMIRLLSQRKDYRETHNAFFDALDELEIMKLLGHSLDKYIPL